MQTAEQAEHEEEFHRIAEERWTTLLTTGKTVPWEDARSYILARARGEHPRKPPARKIEHCRG